MEPSSSVLQVHFNRTHLSTLCGTNMTEVAQVAAAVALDKDDVTDENEHNMTCQDNDMAEETKEKASHTDDNKPCQMNDASSKTDNAVNGVEHKESEANKENDRPEAVNGVEQDTENTQTDPNEDQNISDLMFKKEVSPYFKI